MKTQRERDAEKREEKLRDINEAVADGRLVIREMTNEERARFAPREDKSDDGRRPRRR